MLRGLVLLFVLVPVLVWGQVTAVGQGVTEGEALKSAFVNAVDQTVGTFISSKLLIENGELIEGKVLSLSKGFIESYKHVGTEKVSGGYKVTIEAVVKQEAVKAKVTEVFKAEVGIDISEFAKAYTKSERNVSAKEIIKEEFPKLAERLVDSLKMEIVKITIDSDKATDTVPFRLDLRLSVDKAKYDAVVAELDKYLVQFGTKGEYREGNVKDGLLYIFLADGRGYEYDIPAVLEADLLEVFFYDLHKRITELNWKVGFVNKDGNTVNKKYGFYFKNGSFSEYLGALGDCDRKEVHSVLLVSAGGGLDLMWFSCIGNKEYTIGGGSFDGFYIGRAKIILPTADFQKGDERLAYSDLRKPASLTTDFFVSGEMTLAELENLKKIEVSRVK